ncbi:MAG: GNAT family N-acetyltransferase [Actinobacteria bacterium]|nr:GNAT family N-acetyltransferase [Actinomycetota bacterium]
MRFRFGDADDLPAIQAALLLAANWDPSRQPRPLDEPTLMPYHDGWGRKSDLAVVAEEAGHAIGAAYCRLMRGFGYIDDDTPEVTVGVDGRYRGRGIGEQLLRALTEIARRHGFDRLSLSVEPHNPARRLYERLGYRQVGVDEAGGIVMLLVSQRVEENPERSR